MIKALTLPTLTRKNQIVAFMVLCLAVHFAPLALSGVTSWGVTTDWTFRSFDGGGTVNFDSAFTATRLYFQDSQVRFDNFDMGTLWSGIGFQAPASTTVLVTDATSYDLDFDVTVIGGYSTFRVYVGDMGTPESVSGVSSWSYSSNVVQCEVTTDGTITITWAETVPTSVTNLITQYLVTGDLSGYIIASYTQSMGLGFFAIILLPLVAGTYMKAGSGPAVIIALLGWGIFYLALPANAIAIARIIIPLVLGIYVVYLFLSRRN